MGYLIRINTVALVSPPPVGFRGFHVDVPKAGSLVEAGAVDLAGWVLGDGLEVRGVEVALGGRVVRRLPLGVGRPDLAEAFPDVGGAGRAGFRGSAALLGLERELRLGLRAVLADGRRVEFASIEGVRCWRESVSPAERELVSVVIPCFGQAHFLAEAIESALAQSYPHVEVVVVDDGSLDNTVAVVERYPGVRYVRQDNQGLAAARNTGLRHSNGDFLVFLDADDKLLPHALETGLRHLEAHPEAAFVSGHYEHVGRDGEPIATPQQAVVEHDHYAGFLRRNLAGMPGTVLFRRAVFEHVQGFDASYPGCEDYELYLRITRQFPVVGHGEVVGCYRLHRASMSRSRPDRMLTFALAVLAAQRPYVRRQSHLRRAYRDGVRFWRRYFGAPLSASVRTSFAERRIGTALRGAIVLARRDPRGLLEIAKGRS
jgi:glycosyltransferase involved in cell wall biosynthesis